VAEEKALERLRASMAYLRDAGSDPLAVLAAITENVDIDDNFELSLADYSVLSTFFKWDSPMSFDDTARKSIKRLVEDHQRVASGASGDSQAGVSSVPAESDVVAVSQPSGSNDSPEEPVASGSGTCS